MLWDLWRIGEFLSSGAVDALWPKEADPAQYPAGRDAVDDMLSILDSADTLMRARIVWSLGRLEDQRAVRHLIPILGELRLVDGLRFDQDQIQADANACNEFTFSAMAAHSLRGLKEQEFVDAFFRALDRDAAAIPILQKRGRTELVAALLRAIDSDLVPTCNNAAWALVELRAAEAMPELRSRTNIFSRSSESVQALCAATMAQLEAVTVLPRPAAATPEGIESLPRPANQHEPSSDTLPRTSAESQL